MYLLQLIALTIYALVMFCALRDFKRTVLVWVPMSLLFNPQVCVLYNPPITALTVAVDLSLIVYYFFFCKGSPQRHGFNNDKFFFVPAMGIMIVSYVLSTLFSEIPFATSFNRIVKTVVDYFGMLIILFRCLNTKEDIKLFVKALAVSAFIFCADGIVEFVIGENLWADFVFFNSKCDESTLGRGWYFPNYMTNNGGIMRFGMRRCISFFQLHLMFGFACSLVLYIMMVMFRNREKLIERFSMKTNNIIYYVLFAMLGLGVVVCNSKGPMICVLFIMLTQYKFTDIFRPMVIAPIIIAIVVIVIYFPDYLLNFVSLVDEDVAEEGRGSTIELRQSQFEVALQLFSNNPLVGNGINSVKYFQHNGFEEIHGAESIWLKLLPDQGLFGAIAYIYQYIVLKNCLKGIVPFKIGCFFLLAILIFDTTNGGGYAKITWWLGVLLAVRRYHQINL